MGNAQGTTQRRIIVVTRRSEDNQNSTQISQTSSSMQKVDQSIQELKKLENLLTLTSLLFKSMINMGSKRHRGIVCDSCGKKDFEEDRFKCLLCIDYDLCATCFEQSKESKNHKTYHSMLCLEIPIKTERSNEFDQMIQERTISSKFQDQIHRHITCDGCKSNQIHGIRLKCDKCVDYDLCWKCWEKKTQTLSHKTNHKMIAYLTPYVERYDVNRDVDFMENESTARSGCFGSVRKAKLIPLNKIVAAKKLTREISKETLELFFNEQQAMRELRSTKIIKYYGWGIQQTEKGLDYYIFSEFMEGGNLEDLIENNQSLSLRRKIELAKDIAQGLTRIHEKNYVHKDIKPNNILLDSDGNYPNAKIGDMGIAICHKNKGTRPQDFLCPPYFKPPEIQFQQEFTTKVDIFQFGLTFQYMLDGEMPDNDLLISDDQIFGQLIKRCLNPSPDIRPTAQEIYEELNEFIEYFWSWLPISQMKYIQLDNDEKNQILIEAYQAYINEG